ncbi:MAG TPA: sigma-70 family RNA polymerase sigma factor [Thermomicrobiales bacterium]|nr:sigma-70 family RNA polymerase sigma factor [Thermomicrobiales bacterium]
MSKSLPLGSWDASSIPREKDEEDQWIAAARVDPAAFAPLYERHAPAIYRFVHRRTGDPDTADDLTAQIFVRAIERIDRYRTRPNATFRSWLFAIARNMVTDTWRRQRPQVQLNPAIDTLTDRDPDPEALAIAGDEYAALCAVLDTLPDSQRAIVEFRLAGLTTREIMATMGMSEPAVKSAQTRAYRRLRDIVPPEGFMS